MIFLFASSPFIISDSPYTALVSILDRLTLVQTFSWLFILVSPHSLSLCYEMDTCFFFKSDLGLVIYMFIPWLYIHRAEGIFTETARDLNIYNYLGKFPHGQDPIYKFVAEQRKKSKNCLQNMFHCPSLYSELPYLIPYSYPLLISYAALVWFFSFVYIFFVFIFLDSFLP